MDPSSGDVFCEGGTQRSVKTGKKKNIELTVMGVEKPRYEGMLRGSGKKAKKRKPLRYYEERFKIRQGGKTIGWEGGGGAIYQRKGVSR